jgi:polar amino acid transport system substrate-binding protein
VRDVNDSGLESKLSSTWTASYDSGDSTADKRMVIGRLKKEKKGMLMKKIIFVFCILSLVLCGCAKKEEARMLKVAACPTSPPNMFEENGKYQGLDLEIFEGFCKARGYQYQITAYDWQGMLEAVISGQADVAFSGISITEKRKEKLDFSQPYMDNTWNLVSLKKRNIRIKDLVEFL